MIWASKKGTMRGVAAAVLTAALAGTALAGPVVLRATGPSAKTYPVGRQVPDTAQLVLKPGDTLVLLDSRGTRTLSGPGSFPANGMSARTSSSQVASRILANTGTSERRGGAVRGGLPTQDTRSPNLWFVDLTKSGTICVADPSTMRVWRASGAKAADVKVSGAGASGDIALAAGATVGDWPKSVPVTNGAEYTLSAEGMAPAKIKVVTVPAPTSLEDTASQLIAKGCNTQLDLLIATTSTNGSAG
ncbi:hypothetical protein ACFSCW_10375 [Sphingomonas tabacisoli]|uniref:Uncharacterized protein n=1 Tax=Sphingomonas tabacisoli TaxID=2249466 RepID=A0ABW4I3U5_9SPHN